MIQDNNIPIVIVQDWTRVRQTYSKLIANAETGALPKLDYLNGVAYDIGNVGRLSLDVLTTGEKWYVWTGAMLESMLPWMTQLKPLFSQARLNYVACSYYQHQGNIGKHVDSKPEEFQHHQCNLNYVIQAQDKNCKSYYEMPDGVHFYPAQESCAYLINSGVPHWVTNQGLREIFQLRFNTDYEKLMAFFDHNAINLSQGSLYEQNE